MTTAKFITLEGSEGVGKSTQCKMLCDALQNELRHASIVTREPGGTLLGESVRSILLDPKLPAMTGMTELLLMFAARSEHLAEVIRPALDENRWVVCDRFTDASYAYQGAARSLGSDSVLTLEALVQNGFSPDLTFILDLDIEIAFARIAQRGEADRFELEKRAFFEKVRHGYLQRAAEDPQRIVVVDAAPAPAAVHAQIMRSVRDRLL